MVRQPGDGGPQTPSEPSPGDGADGDALAAAGTEPSWYARHPMLTATLLGLLAGGVVAALDLSLGSPGRDWRGSAVLPAGLITGSVLLTLARVRRSARLHADRFGLVLAALVGVALVVIGVSVIPGSTTVPRVLNGGLVTLLGLVLAVAAGAAAIRRPAPHADGADGSLDPAADPLGRDVPPAGPTAAERS